MRPKVQTRMKKLILQTLKYDQVCKCTVKAIKQLVALVPCDWKNQHCSNEAACTPCRFSLTQAEILHLQPVADSPASLPAEPSRCFISFKGRTYLHPKLDEHIPNPRLYLEGQEGMLQDCKSLWGSRNSAMWAVKQKSMT